MFFRCKYVFVFKTNSDKLKIGITIIHVTCWLSLLCMQIMTSELAREVMWSRFGFYVWNKLCKISDNVV